MLNRRPQVMEVSYVSNLFCEYFLKVGVQDGRPSSLGLWIIVFSFKLGNSAFADTVLDVGDATVDETKTRLLEFAF